MEEKILKLVSYLGLLALVAYAIASGFGKRSQLKKKPSPCGREQKANGQIWARYNVPAATALRPAGVGPQTPLY